MLIAAVVSARLGGWEAAPAFLPFGQATTSIIQSSPVAARGAALK
jgi:hypothetical protein